LLSALHRALHVLHHAAESGAAKVFGKLHGSILVRHCLKTQIMPFPPLAPAEVRKSRSCAVPPALRT
jgi:hypothetical protein